MAIGQGYRSKCVAAKETTFRTAVDCTDLIPFTDESFFDERVQLQSDVLTGKAGRRFQDIGNLIVTGSLSADLAYDKLASAQFFGTDLLISAAMGGVQVYANDYLQMRLSETMDCFLTICIARRPEDAGVQEFTSCFCKSMTISGSAGQPIKIATEWVAFDVTRTGQENTWAEVDAVATGEVLKRVLFNQGNFMLGDLTNVLVTGTDEVAISDFTFTLNNNVSDPEYATDDIDALSVPGKMLLPVRAGKRDVTLEITRARHPDDTFFGTAYSAGTAFQGQLSFTGGATWNWDLYMPYMIIEKPETNISGANPLTEKITFRCLRGTDYNAGAGNTVMLVDPVTQVQVCTEEFAINTENERTAVIISA